MRSVEAHEAVVEDLDRVLRYHLLRDCHSPSVTRAMSAPPASPTPSGAARSTRRTRSRRSSSATTRERLGAVELNNTFYRLPGGGAVPAAGRRRRPRTSASRSRRRRSISFFGRLDQLGTLAERLAVLGPRLGPLLVRARDDRPRDDGFLQLLLESLDPSFLVALDLRHPSWEGVEAGLPHERRARQPARGRRSLPLPAVLRPPLRRRGARGRCRDGSRPRRRDLLPVRAGRGRATTRPRASRPR